MTPVDAYRLKLALETRAKKLRATGEIPFCPHEPFPQQRQFLALDCLDALYGGSAGGGKSDALLMAALQYVNVPGYAALILRRTYQDLALPGAIMDRAKEWLLPQGVAWHDKDKRFIFPSGATITFGYLDTERDKFRYASAEFQAVLADELTQFPEAWITFLFSRLRKPERASSPISRVPLRFRAASNPGGIGHEWVRRRYIEKSDRPFIPSRLDDNPFVHAESYRKALEQLDASTRRQLLEGVWTRDAGGLVYQYEAARDRVQAAPRLTHKILGVDFGVVDDCAFTIAGWRENDPCVYLLESYRKADCGPVDAAFEVLDLMRRHAFDQIVGDEGGMGKAFADEARKRFNIPYEAAQKTNKRGYIALFNGALERGQIKIVAGACADLESEWLELPWNEERTKEADGFNNHAADSALYGWRAAPNFHERMAEELPPIGTRERALVEAQRDLADQDDRWERKLAEEKRLEREERQLARWENG